MQIAIPAIALRKRFMMNTLDVENTSRQFVKASAIPNRKSMKAGWFGKLAYRELVENSQDFVKLAVRFV
jgi:hypothetical protein